LVNPARTSSSRIDATSASSARLSASVRVVVDDDDDARVVVRARATPPSFNRSSAHRRRRFVIAADVDVDASRWDATPLVIVVIPRIVRSLLSLARPTRASSCDVSTHRRRPPKSALFTETLTHSSSTTNETRINTRGRDATHGKENERATDRPPRPSSTTTPSHRVESRRAIVYIHKQISDKRTILY
jgi:hypothetical protein